MHTQPDIPPDWTSRYLRLLGLEREAPSRDALARLTRRQILTVPFGNVTSLLRYRAHRGEDLPPLDFDALLRLWEEGRGTGVCFEVTGAFGRLLTALGYDARPVPGFIAGFMGGHQALVVTLDGGQRYLVDAGNGAPIFEPVPIGPIVEVHHAGLSYRFRPKDEAPGYLQERLINGEWTPFCHYELRDQTDAEFDAAYRRHHVPRESFVVGEMRLVRCTEETVSSLRGAELNHFTPDGKQVERLASPDDYARVARDVFALPALPLAEAAAVLAELEGAGAAP